MKISKITKVAGAGLLGFCAVSLAADNISLNPMASQIAGFAGAFVGSLMAKRTKTKQVAISPVRRHHLPLPAVIAVEPDAASDSDHTESELLFEEYLRGHGYRCWTYEIPVEGKVKKPDYRLERDGSSLFFEVKEFDTPPPLLGFSVYDPYGPIREKINKAARQFKEYKEFPCSVVLANPKAAFVHLGDPWAIIGAMLGNLGVQFQFGVTPDKNQPMEQVFLGGGKMVNDKRQEPQNTTISSVIVLAAYPLRQNRIRIAIKERQRELGRDTTLDENLEFYEAIPDSSELRRVRVIVYENPFARIPLSRDLFRGPFDERWGVDAEFIRRIYVGDEVSNIETQLADA